MTSLDARSVTVPLAALTDHLGCSLCHGMLRDAQTITECLHSFCKSCIYRHFLVQGSKQCPKCLMTLTARPITTLIPDQRLQDVVDRIFPEFKARDAELEQEFYEKHNFKRKETDEATVAASGEKATKSTGAVVSSSTPAPSTVQLYTVEMSPKPVETPLPALERPYLQVDGKLKMFELRKLLQKRLDLDKPEMLELSCLGATVGPELSVHFIHRTIWHPQQQKPTLELHYSLLSA